MKTDPAYDHLDDPQERKWLTALKPKDVLANAHRIYEWMAEQGVAPDSYTREMAFDKASAALSLDYDVFYDAWLSQTPIQKAST